MQSWILMDLILYKIKRVEPLKICFQLFWKVSVDNFESFLLKIAVQSMTTEVSNLTIFSVKEELGLQFHFLTRNRNKCKACFL